MTFTRDCADHSLKSRAWRGWLWIALIVAAVALEVVSLSARAAEPVTIPDVFPYAPTRDHRGTEEQPLIVSKPSAEHHDDETERLDHDRNERGMATATVVLAVFTALLWLANIWLIIETRRVSARQADDTKLAIGEAKRSADAMQEVATATKNNATLMSDIISRQMRAYISVAFRDADSQLGTANFAGYAEISNTGLTPAKNISYRVKADVLSFPVAAEFHFPESATTHTHDVTISAHGSLRVPVLVEQRFSNDEVAAIMKGDTQRMYIWGSVFYEDVFGGKRETKFCQNFNFYESTDQDTGKKTIRFGVWYHPGHNSTT